MKRLLFVLSVCLLLTGLVSAQSAIQYGQALQSTLSAETPLHLYSFNGEMGDLITIDTVSLDPTLQLSVGVLNSMQQTVATQDVNDTRLTYRLQVPGLHSIIVSAANGGIGNYILKLDKEESLVSMPLELDIPQQFEIPMVGPVAAFSIAADPGATRTLFIASLNSEFPLKATLRDEKGQMVAMAQGDGVSDLSITLRPSEMAYELVITSTVAPPSSGMIQVLLSSGQAAQLPGSSTNPTDPATNTQNNSSGQDPLANVGASGACTLTPAQGNVNLRSGPGTNYDATGYLSVGQTAVATAKTQGGDGYTWYQVNGAWARSDVIRYAGNCNGISTVSVPGSGSSSNATPTTAMSGSTTATATMDPSVPTATLAATATPTTSQQIAGPDSDYVIHIDRDAGGSFSQKISSPDGDTNDFVIINVDGLAPNPPNSYREFQVLLACSGTGTEYVNWGTNRTGSKKCGETLTQVVTNDSDTIFLNARIDGGQGPAYVEYTFFITKIK